MGLPFDIRLYSEDFWARDLLGKVFCLWAAPRLGPTNPALTWNGDECRSWSASTQCATVYFANKSRTQIERAVAEVSYFEI